MVFAVGLTGNIASGKTTAASIFASFGIEVFNADTVARELTALNGPAYANILAHFGNNILQANGEINRRALRDIIFLDAKERNWLEHLLHPLIRQELAQRVILSTSAYCIVEIALLTDKISYPYLNRILLITASRETQIKRVMARDQCARAQAQAILAIQPANSMRLKSADDIVNNDKNIALLAKSLKKMHKKYLAISST